jgi:hypothetical protein
VVPSLGYLYWLTQSAIGAENNESSSTQRKPLL